MWQLISASVIIASSLLTLSNGQNPSVSLTVEGGVSLVGPHCPGTVKLVCEGVDLTFLQWIYNGNTEIDIFVPDDSTVNETNTNNQAFLNVELRSISRDGLRANYTSILTADLSLLQSENVMDIVCAGPTTQQQVSVNVDIIRPVVPEIPGITAVTATYSSGILTSIGVMWNKLSVFCPDYEESLYYEVSITNVSPVQIDHTSCSREGMTCSLMFPVTTNVSEYQVFISALNSEGSSQIGVYPQPIGQRSEDYFVAEVRANFTDCRIQGRCVPVGGLNITCSARYTLDPMYDGPFSATMEEPFAFADLSPETTYYLEFSAIVNENLQLRVINRLQIRTECTVAQNDVGAIAAAVTIPLLIVILLLVIVLVLVAVLKAKSRKKKGYDFGSNSNKLSTEVMVEITLNYRHVSTQTIITGKPKTVVGAVKGLTTWVMVEFRGKSKTEDLVEHWSAESKRHLVPKDQREEYFQSLHQGRIDCSTQTERDKRFPPLKPGNRSQDDGEFTHIDGMSEETSNQDNNMEAVPGECDERVQDLATDQQPQSMDSNQQNNSSQTGISDMEQPGIEGMSSPGVSDTTPIIEKETSMCECYDLK